MSDTKYHIGGETAIFPIQTVKIKEGTEIYSELNLPASLLRRGEDGGVEGGDRNKNKTQRLRFKGQPYSNSGEVRTQDNAFTQALQNCDQPASD